MGPMTGEGVGGLRRKGRGSGPEEGVRGVQGGRGGAVGPRRGVGGPRRKGRGSGPEEGGRGSKEEGEGQWARGGG